MGSEIIMHQRDLCINAAAFTTNEKPCTADNAQNCKPVIIWLCPKIIDWLITKPEWHDWNPKVIKTPFVYTDITVVRAHCNWKYLCTRGSRRSNPKAFDQVHIPEDLKGATRYDICLTKSPFFQNVLGVSKKKEPRSQSYFSRYHRGGCTSRIVVKQFCNRTRLSRDQATKWEGLVGLIEFA